MRIAHLSDLHGRLGFFDTFMAEPPPDLWVFTGDMFPNQTRGDVPVEIPYQTQWYARIAPWWVHRLRKVPVLLVPGNHDYADLAKLLRRDGVNAREVTPEGLDFQGVRFAGFGNIPLIAGEWNRESTYRELHDLTQRSFASDPDILLTHAPPDGILSGTCPGLGSVTATLSYRPHHVKIHMFGHVHEDGGRAVRQMGVLFVNSAQSCQVMTHAPQETSTTPVGKTPGSSGT